MAYNLQHFTDRTLEPLERTTANEKSASTVVCSECERFFRCPTWNEVSLNGEWYCPDCATQERIDNMNECGY